MSKKLQMIMLVLGLSIVIAFTGCSSDDDDTPIVTPPSAASNVSATVTGPTTVSIAWTASLDDAPDGYTIERRLAETEWAELGSVEADITTYDDPTVEFGSGLTYIYHVGAYNTGGTTFSGEVTATVATHQELLMGNGGTWNATDPVGDVGTDSSTFTFRLNASVFEYRRLDYYSPIDDTDWDAGTYTADGDSIYFTVQAINGVPADSTYTWNYDLNTNGEELTVEYDYGEGPFDVDFELVPAPPVD